MRNILLKYSIITGLFLFFCSCKQNSQHEQNVKITDSGDSLFIQGNKTVLVSSDIKKLEQVINLKTYPPHKVRFQYTYFDNSGKNQRLSVPGPSDFSLEALLFFDSETFEKLKNSARLKNVPSSGIPKKSFFFSWLDDSTIQELKNSHPDYRGEPDVFFNSLNGKILLLDKKIVLISYSN